MRQLTSLDVQFLAGEDGRSLGHVSAVSILDPSTTATGQLTIADIHRVFAERQHLLPPLRWRLVEVPLGLDYPYWHDDPEYDLEFHLRELHLPPPGNLSQLAEQVSRIVSRPLDRSRPLWECYLIGGLEDDKVALLIKMHHSVIDGMSGAEILGLLFDLSPEGREIAPPLAATRRETRPSDLRLFLTALRTTPRRLRRLVSALPNALQHLDMLPTIRHLPGIQALARAIHRRTTRGRDGRILEAPLGKAPRTSFNDRISTHRRIELASLSLPEVKAVKNAFGATVNDVVVTLCTTALREWLIAHNELPDQPLLASVPFSVRTAEEMGTFGNRVAVMIVPLATNEPDPVQRLKRTHDTLRSAKDRHRAVPADILVRANHLVPPSLFARAARVTAGLAVTRRGVPPYNVIISNVPGPPVPIYIAGALQVASYPVSLIHEGVGLNITLFSYQDHIDLGLVADRDLIPDLDHMITSLNDALAELLAAAHHQTREAALDLTAT
jgi:WS/DGAT/MGAT family acyltransferase